MTTAIVTGSSSGIGRAIAIMFARQYDVVVNARNDVAGGHETCRLIKENGGTSTLVQADVSTQRGIDTLFAATAEAYGPATILVNNAGATRVSTFGEWTDEHWHDMLSTNLTSCALMCQAFVAQLGDEEGRIVNLASIRGLERHARIGGAAYGAAKAGVISLTATLGRALAPQVTVNAISPGFVETNGMRRMPPDLVDGWRESMPIERFIDPSEIAATALFLVGQSALTGANIVVDGAWTVTDS